MNINERSSNINDFDLLGDNGSEWEQRWRLTVQIAVAAVLIIVEVNNSSGSS